MKANHFAKSPGLCIVFYGPDGAGKSVVAQRVATELAPLFTALQLQHLRLPVRPPQRQVNVTNPHAQQPRGRILSWLKLCYMFAESWLAHLFCVRAWMASGQLVIFDRYFLDYAIDPRRYRLAAESVGLASALGRFAPRPDVQFVLDVPAEELQRRKPEVSLAESRRQRQEYGRRIGKLRNAIVVNAGRPIPEVTTEIIGEIFQFLQRTSHPMARIPLATFQDAAR